MGGQRVSRQDKKAYVNKLLQQDGKHPTRSLVAMSSYASLWIPHTKHSELSVCTRCAFSSRIALKVSTCCKHTRMQTHDKDEHTRTTHDATMGASQQFVYFLPFLYKEEMTLVVVGCSLFYLAYLEHLFLLSNHTSFFFFLLSYVNFRAFLLYLYLFETLP